MKTINLFFCIIFITQLAFGQQDVYLKINHYLGNNAFAFNQTTPNNIGRDFQVTHLRYYISNITLYHDGTQTPIPNMFLLVDASQRTSELLGNFNINTLDSISFGIGVDSAENHLDPALYPTGHPLSYQAPSMHWGWVSGYRFVALEGVSGISMSDVFQIHALGDHNYKIKTIVTTGEIDNNDLLVSIDANYAKALSGIDVSAGLISHGGIGSAEQLLENFNTLVFSDGSMSVPITKLKPIYTSIYPNPVSVGAPLKIEMDQSFEPSIQVYDLSGKLYSNAQYSSQDQSLRLMDSGWYILEIKKDGKLIASQKISVVNE